MDLGITGRKALVMGASRGLGRAVAEALIKAAFLASDRAGYITGRQLRAMAVSCNRSSRPA